MPPRHELEYPFVTQQTKELRQGPAYLAGIAYFPGKSMAPNFLAEAFVDEVGIRPTKQSNTSDRQFMLTDPRGHMESQRTLPGMARLSLAVERNQIILKMDDHQLYTSVQTRDRVAVKVHATDGIAAIDQGDVVFEWLLKVFGKPLRLVRQVDSEPRRRSELLPQIEGINQVLRLQDSSPLTALSHTTLYVLNERLAQFEWFMNAVSFRMNLLIAGAFNEHTAVGKFLRFGEGPTATYCAVWRLKGRCPLPATDQMSGEIQGNEGAPREKLSYIYQDILKANDTQIALGIPPELRTALKKSGVGSVPQALLGIDLFPVITGTMRVGDSITIVDEIPAELLAMHARQQLR